MTHQLMMAASPFSMYNLNTESLGNHLRERLLNLVGGPHQLLPPTLWENCRSSLQDLWLYAHCILSRDSSPGVMLPRNEQHPWPRRLCNKTSLPQNLGCCSSFTQTTSLLAHNWHHLQETYQNTRYAMLNKNPYVVLEIL